MENNKELPVFVLKNKIYAISKFGVMEIISDNREEHQSVAVTINDNNRRILTIFEKPENLPEFFDQVKICLEMFLEISDYNSSLEAFKIIKSRLMKEFPTNLNKERLTPYRD